MEPSLERLHAVSSCRACGCTETKTSMVGIRDWEHGVPGEYSYRVCPNCGINQIDPFPTIADLVEAYPATYPAYIQDVSKEKGGLYKALIDLHFWVTGKYLRQAVPKGATVIDVGAGNGDFLLKLRQVGAGRLVGIDFNTTACEIMAGKGIETFCGVFADYVTQCDFDVVIMNNYIEHVLDPPMEVSKAFRLLRDGGHILGTLPNFAGIDRALFGRYWGGNHVPRHTYQYTPQSLERILAAAGFVDIKIKQDINPSHIAISIQNYCQRRVENLANNPRIKSGRAPYYNYLLLAMLPVNAIFTLLGRSGVMSFSAKKHLQ